MFKVVISIFLVTIYASSCYSGCVTHKIAGGISRADVSDPDVIAAADFAIQRIYGTLNDYVLVSAQQQVVAGIKYYLNFKIIDSGEECSVEIVVRSWLNERNILSNTCNNGKIATTTPSTDYST